MSVQIHIVDGAIGGAAALAARATERGLEEEAMHLSLTREALLDGVGAVIVFDGIVRGVEEGRRVVALEYEHYEPMASEQLRALAEDVVRRHGLVGLRCAHSRGRVGVGECSMRVTVWSAHRKEGLSAMGEFIDRLKRDVPIWKRVLWE